MACASTAKENSQTIIPIITQLYYCLAQTEYAHQIMIECNYIPNNFLSSPSLYRAYTVVAKKPRTKNTSTMRSP